MDLDLVNKLSNLTMYGYYDPSKDMVVVHFFNKDEQKSDILAYLRKNMSWDVREIVDEKAQLFANKEVIELTHKNLGVFEKDSNFDKFIRTSLMKITNEKNIDVIKEQNKMFRILEENQYDN